MPTGNVGGGFGVIQVGYPTTTFNTLLIGTGYQYLRLVKPSSWEGQVTALKLRTVEWYQLMIVNLLGGSKFILGYGLARKSKQSIYAPLVFGMHHVYLTQAENGELPSGVKPTASHYS